MTNEMVRLQTFRRNAEPNEEKSRPLQLTRKRYLLLAFAIVSFPTLAIGFLLIGFVFKTSERERPNHPLGTTDFPVPSSYTSDAYYTDIPVGSFLLVSSWASNVAEIIVSPFMVLFSYIVAREHFQASTREDANPDILLPSLREILRGAHSRCPLLDPPQQVKSKSGYKANNCGSNSWDCRTMALDSPNHIQKENTSASGASRFSCYQRRWLWATYSELVNVSQRLSSTVDQI